MLGLLFVAWWSDGCCWVLDGGVGHQSGDKEEKKNEEREKKKLK